MIEVVTVSDMFDYTRSKNIKLLSEYQAVFWNEYTTNSAKYDALFRRMFYSFRYFLQNYDSTIQSVTEDFINDVYAHLLVNDKKYSELYRIHVITDSEYSITDNYNITEEMSKQTSKDDKDMYGARTDNGSDVFGKRTDTNETETGEQTNTGTNTIAGFNSTGFENDNQVTDNIGTRTDTSTVVTGEQNNNSEFTKGSQEDSHVGSGTEDYKLTRTGNIGTKTVTEVMKEHAEFWSRWEFYTLIFKDICSELLLI